MKLIFSVIVFLAGISFARAQQASISGRVTDEKQKPVEFATVLLLRTTDSTILKSSLTNGKGVYKITVPGKGTYLLSTSAVGFKKTYKQVQVAVENLEVADIQLEQVSSLLKEVSITARKPFLEQRPDKLVVNVEGSATAAGATALEVLQKVPGLIVTNDKLTMVGKGAPTIMIDGRVSQYTDMTQVLRDITSANISRIEVIANPGAKYDAAGGSVINIILKKNANLGTNGSVSFSSGMGLYERGQYGTDRNYYRVSPSISLNHREGKINAFGNYSYFHNNTYDYSEFRRIIGDTTYFQRNYNPNTGSSHNFRAGADFYADAKNTYGFLVRGFIRGGDRTANNATSQFPTLNQAVTTEYGSENNSDNKRNNFSANLNWKHSFDTLGTDLNVDLDYSQFSLRNSGIITTNYASSSTRINQLVDNPVKFGVAKVDFAKNIGKEGKIEAGAKSSVASIDNFPTYSENNVFKSDRSADFWYHENINALYASAQQKFGKWNLQAGLRAEQTIATGKDSVQMVLNRNYIQLFPSAFITRNLNSKIATVLQYTRRVNRPSYQQQNPFVEFLDALTYTQGNPKLKPETADQYKLSVTYQNQPFFGISYNKKKDVIFDNAPKQEGNRTYTTPENLASFENVAIELNFPIALGKKISGFGGNQAVYNHYTANYLNDTYDRGKWNWLAYWQVAYKPEESWSIELNGYYMTKFLNEFILLNNLGSLNIGIQKTFWDKKGKLALNFNDVFLSDRVKGLIQYNAINVDFRQVYDSRNARLTFSYSFGNQQLKAARNRKTASEDENNRVKAN